MANDLKNYLGGIDDADVSPGDVDDELLDRWAGSESKLQVRANVHRFLVGRALKYRRVQLQRGDRGPWLEEVGKRWGRSVTTLRGLMRIANVIEVALRVSEENGKDLPITHSIRNHQNGPPTPAFVRAFPSSARSSGRAEMSMLTRASSGRA